MAARVLIINPSGEEDRGVLDDVLQEANAKVLELATKEAVALLDGAPSKTARIVSSLPGTSRGHDCLIVLGSPRGVVTGPPGDGAQTPAKLTEEMEVLVRDFHSCEKPVLGICLGAEVIARAYGGEVYSMPRDSAHTALPVFGEQPAAGVEFGFHSQDFTSEAESDAVVGPALKAWRDAQRDDGSQYPSGAAPKFMEWHSDTYDFPEGAVVLSTRPSCPNQAFRIGRRTYAFQYHIEVGNGLADEWYEEYAEGTATHASSGAQDPLKIDKEMAKQHLQQVVAEGGVDRSEAFCRSVMKSLLEQATSVRKSQAGSLSPCSSTTALAATAVLSLAAVVAAGLLRRSRS